MFRAKYAYRTRKSVEVRSSTWWRETGAAAATTVAETEGRDSLEAPLEWCGEVRRGVAQGEEACRGVARGGAARREGERCPFFKRDLRGPTTSAMRKKLLRENIRDTSRFENA